MTALSGVGVTIGCVCAAVSIFSVLVPQKRTRRIMGFVIGLFFIGTLLSGIINGITDLGLLQNDLQSPTLPAYSEDDYTDAVAQMTADHLTEALAELLRAEGINPQDVRLTLKISAEGRITVSRVVIYMSENDVSRVGDAERIVYRNVSKEPEIYAAGEKLR